MIEFQVVCIEFVRDGRRKTFRKIKEKDGEEKRPEYGALWDARWATQLRADSLVNAYSECPRGQIVCNPGESLPVQSRIRQLPEKKGMINSVECLRQVEINAGERVAIVNIILGAVGQRLVSPLYCHSYCS